MTTPDPAATGVPQPLSFADTALKALFAILVIRASLDNFLIAYGGPLGGVLNAVVIAACVVLFRSHVGPRVPAGKFWAAFLAMCGLAIFYAPDPIGAIRFYFVLGTYCAMFLAPCVFIRHERDVATIIKVVLASAPFPILVGLLDFNAERAQATFNHPNIYAFYLALIMLTVALAWVSRIFTHTTAERLMLVGLAGLTGLLLIMTQTRGAWLGLAAAIPVIAVFYDRRLLIGVFVMPFALLLPQIQERLSDLNETTEFIGNGMIANSYEWRRMLWESAMVWIWQNPVFGYGLNSFSFFSPKFFPWESTGFNSHNVYVQLLFETGLIGLCLFIILFLSILFTAFRYRKRAPEASAFILALCTFYLIICYSDNILYYLNFNWYFWVLLGSLRAWLLLPTPQEEPEVSFASDLPRSTPFSAT